MHSLRDVTRGQQSRPAYLREVIGSNRLGLFSIRRVDTGDETLAELGVLVGLDDDLSGKPPGSATVSADC